MRGFSARSRRWLYFGVTGALLLALGGCKVKPASSDGEVVTQVQALSPAGDRMAAGAGAPIATASAEPEPSVPDRDAETMVYCRQVEQQARETNASLPQRLDKDTSATRIVAYGCDVVLEYAMLDLRVSDVAVNGVLAMRDEVLDKLCADGGARGVMDHGGSFTNVYRDERSALIDQFTIAAEDCGGRRALAAPPSVDL
jgi:hypothetical protein